MEAKEALANTTVLLHPFMDAPTSVITDASDIVVGAILQQFIQDEWCPISYFSRKLKPAKMWCSTFWPGTTLASWIKHFQHILKGCQFYILTNNKPLIYSLPSYLMDIPFGRYDPLTLYPKLHQIYITSRGVQIKLPMPYLECRQSPRFQLQLSILSSWRLLNMTTLQLSELQSGRNCLKLRDILFQAVDTY